MVNTKRILSITHEQDVDGLFCGTILKNSFPDTLVFLTNYGQENMKRVSEIIKFNISRSTKPGTVVVSDLGIDNKSDLEPIEEAIYQSKNYGWDFVWLDHHSWDKEIKLKVESFVTLICTSIIAKVNKIK
jgi:oligoribonuclease NrnB/cAMP/cGMP phosphodiesterase (DHH superfamily)